MAFEEEAEEDMVRIVKAEIRIKRRRPSNAITVRSLATKKLSVGRNRRSMAKVNRNLIKR